MGIDSSKFLEEKISEENKIKFNNFEKKDSNKIPADYKININYNNNDYKIYKKIIKNEKEIENINLTKEQNNIINQFNSSFPNLKGVELCTLFKYRIILSKKNPNVRTIDKKKQYIKYLNEINPMFGNIDLHEIIFNLKNELSNIPIKDENNYKISNENEKKILKKIKLYENFNLNITQIIFQDYNFEFSLWSLKKGNYQFFDFNILNKPILIIFFNYLSNIAIEKIKEVYKEINYKTKNLFLFLPILNSFFKENEKDLINKRIYLEILDIDDFYILTQKNKNFINLFQLNLITESKVIIINQNKEISYILNNKIEFLKKEIVEYYLYEKKFDEKERIYFNKKSKKEITELFKSKIYKNYINNFKHDYSIEIIFQEIDNKTYPINFNYKYDLKDKKNAEDFFIKIKWDIAKYVKNFFISVVEINKNLESIVKVIHYINGIFIEKKFNTNSKNFEINTIREYLNSNKMKKKYFVYFKLFRKNDIVFNQILLYFKNYPQFNNLDIEYFIIPQENVNLQIKHIKCNIIKLFDNENIQSKFDNINEEIDYKLNNNIVIILNPNYFINWKNEKKKIIQVIEMLILNNIYFTIIIFSENYLDYQKLKYLNCQYLFLNNLNDDYKKFNIIYINSLDIENFSYFLYYSKNITFKLLEINLENNKLLHFIDLDEIPLKKLYNKFDMDLIDYWVLLNDNKNEKENLDFDYKNIKKEYLNIYSESKYLQIISKNKIFTNINLLFSYEQNMPFIEEYTFNKLEINNFKFITYLTYQDSLKNEIKIENVISNWKKKEKKYKNIFILNYTELKTENLFFQHSNCAICPNKVYITNNSFFVCLECQNKFQMCNNCYKTNIKNIHEHPIIFIYNFNRNLKSNYFIDIYDKFKQINIENSNNENICSFCEKYINDNNWLNIVISHIKSCKEFLNPENLNIIFICEECFLENKFEKYKNEIVTTNKNLLIMKIQKKINKLKFKIK